MIESRIILDSIGAHAPRLVTMLARYPKFVHSEHLRHRSFSFSVSSSRAIPVAKNLEEARSDEFRATPVWWGREQKGMQSGEELDEKNIEDAKESWKYAAFDAIEQAEQLLKLGVHKSIVNRLLEPFLHVNVLVTSTEPGWMNFFGLRLDRAAQPEIRALAEAQWKCWNESRPTKLEPGQWHLPFVDVDTELQIFAEFPQRPLPDKEADKIALKISVARCARLSYLSFETQRRSTIEEDLALYERLVGASPIHASPAEHQATPDEQWNWGYPMGTEWIHKEGWKNPGQAGNLGLGWRQYRKMLPREAVAPLPEGYSNVQS